MPNCRLVVNFEKEKANAAHVDVSSYIMTILNTLRLLYGLQSGFCFLFYYASGGLGYLEADGETYTPVRNLMSSGSDDDIAIIVLGIISLLILLLLIQKKWKITSLNFIVVVGFFLQLMSVMLIEVGSLIDTIIFGRSIMMLCIVLCQCAIFLLWVFNNVNNTIKAP